MSDSTALYASLDTAVPPIVVGATGGSGTRALVSTLETLDVYMGVHLNHAGDAMPFEPALDRYLPKILGRTRTAHYALTDLPTALLNESAGAVLRAAAEHLRMVRDPGRPWGFKNPRQIFLLPILNELFPGFRFIHLVRDGRDMALSTNRNQVNKYDDILYHGRPEPDPEFAAIRLWSDVNVDAARCARYILGERYLEVRYEDLCDDTDATIRAIAAFTRPDGEALRPEVVDRAVRSVSPSSTRHRWRALPAKRASELVSVGRKGLAYFSYGDQERRSLGIRTTPTNPPIIVLGMHRSGTSAAARLLVTLGHSFGSSLMPPAAFNPEGYWENEKLVAVNYRLLTILERSWDNASPLPDGWLTRPEVVALAGEAADLVAREANAVDRFALKDPRMALLAEFWLRVLERAAPQPPRCVLVVRHPLEVADSLRARDGLPVSLSVWLWIQHVLEAESATRRYPRLVVSFDEMLDTPTDALSRLGTFTGAGSPGDDGGVRPSGRHHRHGRDSAEDGFLGRIAHRLYREVLKLTTEDSGAARARISQLARLISGRSSFAAPIVEQAGRARRNATQLAWQLQEQSSAQKLALYRHRDILTVLQDEAERLRAGWTYQYEQHRFLARPQATYRGYGEWCREYDCPTGWTEYVSSFFDELLSVSQYDLVAFSDREEPRAVPAQLSLPDRVFTACEEATLTSEAFRTWLSDAHARHVALWRHGYDLGTEALTKLHREAILHPDCVLLYGDEDSVGDAGRRDRPWFKSRVWDLDEHLERDIAGGVVMVPRDVLLQVLAGWPAGRAFTLFALTLELNDQHPGGAIRHVPEILSSRRIGGPPLERTAEERREALRAYFGPQAEVLDGVVPATNRIRYPLPEPAPKVSILIPTRDGGRHLARCLDGIVANTAYRRYEIIILDNGSEDEKTVDLLERYGRHDNCRVIRHDAPFNYSELNNIGKVYASGSVLCLLNDDAIPLHPEWLDELVRLAVRPEVGVVGATLLYEDHTVQHAGVVLGNSDSVGVHFLRSIRLNEAIAEGYCTTLRQYAAVTGAVFVLRAEVYDELGGLDQDHLPVNYNDVDFCLKARRAGYRVLCTPHARLLHLESITRSRTRAEDAARQWRRDVDLMEARWGRTVREDPYLNPNVSDHHTFPVLAFPPRSTAFWDTAATAGGRVLAVAAALSRRHMGLPSPLAHYRAANMALSRGYVNVAEALCETAAGELPDDPRIVLTAAAIKKAQGKSDEASALYSRFLDRFPDSVVARVNHANLLLEQGKPEVAEVLFRSALADRPLHVDALINHSIALRRLDRPSEAQAALLDGLRTFPDDARLSNHLGITHLQLSEASAAVACFRRCLVYDPDAEEPAINLAVALDALGDREAAIAQFEAVTARFDVSNEVFRVYVRLLSDLKREGAALALLETRRQSRPLGDGLTQELARLQLVRGSISDGFGTLCGLRAKRLAVGRRLWDGRETAESATIRLDLGDSLPDILLLLPAIRKLGATVAGLSVSTPPALCRLLEAVLPGANFGHPAPEDPADRVLLLEQLPLLSGVNAFNVTSALRKGLRLPEAVGSTVLLAVRDDGLARRALASIGHFPGWGSDAEVRRMSAAPRTGLRFGRFGGAREVAAVREPWDYLDKLGEIARSTLLVTDRPDIALLGRLAGGAVFLLNPDDCWYWRRPAFGAVMPNVRIVSLRPIR